VGLGTPAVLSGTATDDGMPNGTLVPTWSQVSAPPGGSVVFGSPGAFATTATFAASGNYVLRLSVGDGQATSSDDLTVFVNSAPVVNAGPDLTTEVLVPVALSGASVSDSSPTGTLTTAWSKVSGPGPVSFGDPAVVDTTATFSVAGGYVLRLTATDGNLLASDDAAVQVQVAGGPAALLVVGSGSDPGDAALETRIGDLGYALTVGTDATATTADAAGKTFVFLSATTNATTVASLFRDVTAPVLVAQPALFDDMQMTGASSGIHFGTSASQTQLRIVAAGHPLTAGLTGTITATSSAADYSWGSPADTAVIALRTMNLGQGAVFGYEPGANMIAKIAPARRVGLFPGVGAPTTLTADGWSLVEAAIHWAANAVAAPTFNPAPPFTFTSVPQTVTLSSATAGTEIRFTTDGSEPMETSTLYATPGISVTTTTTIKAKAFKTGMDPSATSTGAFTVSLGTVATPTITATPAGADLSVTLQTTTSGASIFYTTDGTAPTEASSLYAAPLTISDATTLKARAFKSDWTPSAVATAVFTFDPDGDGLSNAQEQALGTDPNDPDSNDDGIDDGAAIALGISATDLDMDDDGVLNSAELAQGTNPFNADTDGDAVGDGADCFPVDPAQQCPPGSPTDQTPPVITLTEPPGAVLISSNP
jgi:hypothetical protein